MVAYKANAVDKEAKEAKLGVDADTETGAETDAGLRHWGGEEMGRWGMQTEDDGMTERQRLDDAVEWWVMLCTFCDR